MPTLDRLRSQVAAEAALVDSLTDDFARELDGVIGSLERQIRRLIRTLETDRRGRLVATRTELARALRLRAELRAALSVAGFDDLVLTSLDESLDVLTARVLESRGIMGRAARLTNVDVDTLDAWRVLRQADLLELGEDVTQAVWRSTVDGVIGARDPAALTQELAELTQRSFRQARTVYDTAASAYARQVDQLGVEPRPDDRFVYVGPNDTATRPFCQRQLTGEVVTRAELDDLDNGQLPNTLLTAGGWNCRHKWLFLADAEVT